MPNRQIFASGNRTIPMGIFMLSEISRHAGFTIRVFTAEDSCRMRDTRQLIIEVVRDHSHPRNGGRSLFNHDNHISVQGTQSRFHFDWTVMIAEGSTLASQLTASWGTVVGSPNAGDTHQNCWERQQQPLSSRRRPVVFSRGPGGGSTTTTQQPNRTENKNQRGAVKNPADNTCPIPDPTDTTTHRSMPSTEPWQNRQNQLVDRMRDSGVRFIALALSRPTLFSMSNVRWGGRCTPAMFEPSFA